MIDQKTHWETLYKTRSSKNVSWYLPRLNKSLELIQFLNLPDGSSIIDVGGGASTLPDDLLVLGFKNITVLDIAKDALKVSQERLGKKSDLIRWVEGDVTEVSWKPDSFDCWHDRAVFHFLTETEDRYKYVQKLSKALKPGGHVLMATFGPNGPIKCSGLEIVRYNADDLQRELGSVFHLEKKSIEIHKTPFNVDQEFLCVLFKKQPH